MLPIILPHQISAHALRGVASQRASGRAAPSYQLGWPGRCSSTPGLDIVVADDSASVTGPGGTDPVAARYSEIEAAVTKVGKKCRCRRCLALVIHFDTPTHADTPPTLIGTWQGRAKLGRGLRLPWDAIGSSILCPSLARAEAIAQQHPGYGVRLTILTDWQLFDSDPTDVIDRIQRFPGQVLCVGLNSPPPIALESDNTTLRAITYKDPPGALAQAVFNQLTYDRVGPRPVLAGRTVKP